MRVNWSCRIRRDERGVRYGVDRVRNGVENWMNWKFVFEIFFSYCLFLLYRMLGRKLEVKLVKKLSNLV